MLGVCVCFCGLFVFDMAEQAGRTESSSGNESLVQCLPVLCSAA